jgi:hypothetical protein
MSIRASLHSSSKTFRGRAKGWTVAAWLPRLFVPFIGFRRARAQSAAADGARNRNRIESNRGIRDGFLLRSGSTRRLSNSNPRSVGHRDAECDMSAK